MEGLWVPAVLVFFAAVFFTLFVALIAEAVREWWRRRLVAKRLQPVLSGRLRRAGGGDAHDLIRSDQEPHKVLSALGLGGVLSLLEQARLDWSPATFLVLTGGLAFAFGVTVLALSGSLPLAGLVAMVGGAFPYLFASSMRKRRFKRFEEEFPEAIDLLTRAIRAGHPLTSGMQMVADEGPQEVALEFRQASEEQRFGLPFEEALLGMVDRTDLVDVRIFAIAVLIQREVGGNLAEILENLGETIRRRFYLRRQLRVYTAQGRMTGYALAALPIFVGGIIFLIDPTYVGKLFTSRLGLLLVGTAVFLQLIGALWIRKIIDIEI